MLVETRFRKMGGRIVNMNSERPRVATNDTFMFKKGGKSGIYIKPENRGKFTASAKRAGRGVQEHARKVLADPNASPTQKKRANFARNAAKWKKEDGGDLGVFRPTEYDYLRGTQNISPLGTISREEYESFINDTTNIPELRNTVTDASWRNVLNEFKNDPNLGGLEFADVPRPFGTGESITGRYFRDPEQLQRLPIESDIEDVTRKVAPIRRGNTPKTNAYNYRKGRPMNKIEMLLRKMGGKMKKYQDGGEIEQTVPQDNTRMVQNRAIPLTGNQYTTNAVEEWNEKIFPTLRDKMGQRSKNMAWVGWKPIVAPKPEEIDYRGNISFLDDWDMFTDSFENTTDANTGRTFGEQIEYFKNNEGGAGPVPQELIDSQSPIILPESQTPEGRAKWEAQGYTFDAQGRGMRKYGGKMKKYKCGSAMGKACGGKMRTKFSKGAKFQLGDRTMSDK